jgi:hypothetical protein
MQQFTLILKDDSKREFLIELLAQLEFVEFKFGNKAVSQKELQPTRKKRSVEITLKRGSAKGLIGRLPDDFNAPLEDFKEYA